MKRRGAPLPSSGLVAPQDGESPSDDPHDESEDALKLVWNGLMADLGRMILVAHEMDPHRFDEQKVDARKGSLGLAIVPLLGGAAVLMALIQLVVG